MMKVKRFNQEEIIGILKEAGCQGVTIGEVCRRHHVSEQAFNGWRKSLGGVSVSEARRLMEIEKENAGRKRMLAERDVEVVVMKEIILKN